ncbi:unnamed protein product [Bemisia tabaci]|uniref:Acetyl-coenzyme A transporter 1 n=1 Tax=Bemisia tabaci TaxID=7038 RepID=A0A9P0EWX6_BEMTA|nr:unnamed protein product [Bemisia tabaci]
MAKKVNVKITSNTKGDRMNIAVLFSLYLLQGIPLGLCAAIPMLLQNKKVSYRQQAQFSFALWPFSLKLLWAPIVDSLYSVKFGRRKTWLVPVQYALGALMLYLSYFIDDWLSESEPKIQVLTAFCFCMNFLAATQDIAVDGWALTMLRRENVGYASTCNSVGQTAGYFLGYVIFIALESADFCNYWLRSVPSDEGLVKISGFLGFWGLTFLLITTLVAIFKKEDRHTLEEDDMSIKETYLLLQKIISLPNVKLLAFILLTAKIAYSASDGVTALKLIENGVPKEKFALMAMPLVPLQIVLPLFIARHTSGPEPMNVYIKCIPYRLFFNILGLIVVYFTSIVIKNNIVPVYYYPMLVLMYCFHQITLYGMFVSAMAFFARISDPAVGGTYMTLLNTLCNLGGTWTSTVALWFVDSLTWKSCSNNSANDCSTVTLQEQCQGGDGICRTIIDGYYFEVIFCTFVGVVWYFLMRSRILLLQAAQTSDWCVSLRKRRKS